MRDWRAAGKRVYPAAVERAVLEHHERHDGSGYPRGLLGPSISFLGKILLLAEVVSGIYAKFTRTSALRLSMIFRLKHRMFEASLVNVLMPVLAVEVGRQFSARQWNEDEAHLDLVSAAVERWSALRTTVPAEALANRDSGACALIDRRLKALVRALTEAGSLPEDQPTARRRVDEDDRGIAELVLIGRETLWELQRIVNACRRRWPETFESDAGAAADQAARAWCSWADDQIPPMQLPSVVQALA